MRQPKKTSQSKTSATAKNQEDDILNQGAEQNPNGNSAVTDAEKQTSADSPSAAAAEEAASPRTPETHRVPVEESPAAPENSKNPETAPQGEAIPELGAEDPALDVNEHLSTDQTLEQGLGEALSQDLANQDVQSPDTVMNAGAPAQDTPAFDEGKVLHLSLENGFTDVITHAYATFTENDVKRNSDLKNNHIQVGGAVVIFKDEATFNALIDEAAKLLVSKQQERPDADASDIEVKSPEHITEGPGQDFAQDPKSVRHAEMLARREADKKRRQGNG